MEGEVGASRNGEIYTVYKANLEGYGSERSRDGKQARLEKLQAWKHIFILYTVLCILWKHIGWSLVTDKILFLFASSVRHGFEKVLLMLSIMCCTLRPRISKLVLVHFG